MRSTAHRSGSARRSAAGRAPAAALLALLALGGCSSSSGEPAGAAAPAEPADPAEDSIAIRVTPVEIAALSSLYTTSATLRADKQATVIARTQGVIRRLLVEEGDGVAAGQALAELEDDEQKIELDKAGTARDTLEREYARTAELHAQGLVSDEVHEAARRQAEEAGHTTALAELRLRRTVIRAPFAGRIMRRHLDVGASVVDGTAVYDLADLDPLYTDVSVPERHVARLAVGQTVRLSADAANTSGAARIERIAPLVDPASGTVKVTLAAADSTKLRPGSFVRVEIVTDTHDRALVVPRSALIAEGRRWHLYRVAADGLHVERLEVGRGYEEGDRVEIVETRGAAAALAAGDRVVVVGAAALSDGARVDVVESAAPSARLGADGTPRVPA